MTKSQRRAEQRTRAALRAALRGVTHVEACGPNAPAGARCPLPATGAPTFRDPDVGATWRTEVYERDHLTHRLRGAEKVPAQREHHDST